MIDSIRDWLFRPLENWPRYQKISVNDIRHDDGCIYGDYNPDISCDVETASDLSESEFEQMKEIRNIIKDVSQGATVKTTPRRHTCSCDDCGADTDRISFHIKITWNEIKVSREFGMDNSDW